MDAFYGVYLVPVPMPTRMKQVNCFIGEGPDGWVVVDTGFDLEMTMDAWQRALDELKLSFINIHTVFVTHRHPDHLGFAGKMQRLTGAEVYLPEEDLEYVRKSLLPDASEARIRFYEYYHVSPEAIGLIDNHYKRFHLDTGARLTPVRTDYTLKIGELEYRMIHTPGHTDGHFAWYNDKEKVLFIGDHVLPDIFPNVSKMHITSDNPLRRYLESLNALKELEVNLVIPSHGEPFENLSGRIEETIEYHLKRCDAIEEVLLRHRDLEGITRRLYGDRLKPSNLASSFGDVLSHLRYLESVGRVTEENGFFYRNR